MRLWLCSFVFVVAVGYRFAAEFGLLLRYMCSLCFPGSLDLGFAVGLGFFAALVTVLL